MAYPAAVDELDARARVTTGHEDEHDGQVRDGVGKHVGRVADADVASPGGRVVDVV
jgi:hypothetical protein